MKEVFEFLYLGNLMVGKGVSVLLDACEELKADMPSFVCHIVGAGSPELSVEEVRHLVQARGLLKHIQVHGPLYGTEKEAMLKRADAFVFPTYIDCFPLVVLEAMKYSLPVISTEEGAIPDMVKDGENGLLTERKNPHSLASAMKLLVQNPEWAARMGARGEERYRELYTVESYLKNVRNILRQA